MPCSWPARGYRQEIRFFISFRLHATITTHDPADVPEVNLCASVVLQLLPGAFEASGFPATRTDSGLVRIYTIGPERYKESAVFDIVAVIHTIRAFAAGFGDPAVPLRARLLVEWSQV
jgi:hypothetical protein